MKKTECIALRFCYLFEVIALLKNAVKLSVTPFAA